MVRGVAQSGSAPVLGTGGREFESRRPDHFDGHVEKLLDSPPGIVSILHFHPPLIVPDWRDADVTHLS